MSFGRSSRVERMPVGPQIDRLIVMRVLGLEWRSALPDRPKGWYPPSWPEDSRELPPEFLPDLPAYSADAALARKLLAKGDEIARPGAGAEPWSCRIGTARASAPSEALAICRARLLALGIEKL